MQAADTTVLDLIRRAIAVGAPMYNRDDIQGCYEAYVSAAQSIVAQGKLVGASKIRLEKDVPIAVAQASGGDYRSAAWTLRYAFDFVMENTQVTSLPTPKLVAPSASASLAFLNPTVIQLGQQSWEVINDSVMGGVSFSQVDRTQGVAHFNGYATTDSNGGFANARMYFKSPPDWSTCRGIALTVKGDGLKYILDLKTTSSRWGPSYEAAITPSSQNYQRLELLWSDFRPTAYWASPSSYVPPLDASNVDSFGIKRSAFVNGLTKDSSFRSSAFSVMLRDLQCLV